jgi:hypothetical protein
MVAYPATIQEKRDQHDGAWSFRPPLHGGPRPSSQSSSAELESFCDTEWEEQAHGITVKVAEKVGRKERELRNVAVGFIRG